jgi:hypothetical protein
MSLYVVRNPGKVTENRLVPRPLWRRYRRIGLDPLSHYETCGWRAGYDPSGHFSTRDYLAIDPMSEATGGMPAGPPP